MARQTSSCPWRTHFKNKKKAWKAKEAMGEAGRRGGGEGGREGWRERHRGGTEARVGERNGGGKGGRGGLMGWEEGKRAD